MVYKKNTLKKLKPDICKAVLSFSLLFKNVLIQNHM